MGNHSPGKKRALITGITGYLGSHIAKALEAAGFEAYGITPGKASGARMKRADITDASAVLAAVEWAKPDLVVHAAAISSVQKCEQQPGRAISVNVDGTKNIVKAIRAAARKAKLVFISTDYVFDGTRGNFCEKDAPCPKTIYGKTKLAAEAEVRKHPNHMIVRTANIYGSGGNFFGYLTHALSNNGRVNVYSGSAYTPTYLLFFLESLLALLEKDFRGTVHLAGREKTTRQKFALALAKAMGKGGKLVKPVRKPNGMLVASDNSLDCGLLHKLTGNQGPTIAKSLDYELGNLVYPYFRHSDARGSITGLLQEGEWREINFVESKKGCVRGGHYHKSTQEGFFVIEGKMRVALSDLKGGKKREFIAGAGDFFAVPSGTLHTFEILESAKWINLLSKPMKAGGKDIWRK